MRRTPVAVDAQISRIRPLISGMAGTHRTKTLAGSPCRGIRSARTKTIVQTGRAVSLRGSVWQSSTPLDARGTPISLVELKAPIDKVGKSTYLDIPPIWTSNSQNSQVMLNRGDMNVLAGLHFSESTATRRQVERLIGWGLVPA